MMMLGKFRQLYPQGSLVSELIDIDRGIYIVRVSIVVKNVTLATGLAGTDRVETAEDKARERAIATLILDSHGTTSQTDLTSTTKVTPSFAASRNSPPVPAIGEPFEIPSHSYGKNNDLVEDRNNAFETELIIHSDDFSGEVESTSSTNEPVPSPSIPESEVSQEKTMRSPQESRGGNLFEGTANTETRSSNVATETYAPNPNLTTTTESVKIVNSAKFHQIKQKTDIEIKRLGWTKEYGQDFLKSHYGKLSRLYLTDEQLLEFLQYLESQPSPN
ncbi:hypothetical protein I4641_08135 [Waterburya agarophytonicola K14]|uniref:Uncharacterized protein n=1 Tax=Waterburya agarophytonicola KI4 TaxID=2874699 RepID=A0A964BQE5_9CYAN|nr:hypothetical protein [Waterburya agarophytonicola]MCC0176947.1 hypothetical protein [Waterburya agarophytonicola KI4]